MKTIPLTITLCIITSYFIGVLSEKEPFLTTISEYTLAEDGNLNFTELASIYGHKAEEYDVITEDGYVLIVFRISGKKSPVLLFHGIADTADTFIIKGNTSLAITLAEAGYDVWVGNYRGNKYGRSHEYLNPDTEKKFWDYSLHENGIFDLAATVDFIRNKTRQDSISTISHSQGTACHLALTSLRPEYNARIKVSISFAPIAFLNNLSPPLSLVVIAGPTINSFLVNLGIEELFQNKETTLNLTKTICSKGIVNHTVCTLGVFLPLAGFDPTSVDPKFAQVLYGHYPGATSRKSLQHLDQIALRKKFSEFDNGLAINLDVYGSENPPDYNLTAVTMKVALFVAKNDAISKVKDVEYLRDSLPNVVHYKVMEPELWNHFDFLWGPNMTEYLYPSVFKILEQKF